MKSERKCRRCFCHFMIWMVTIFLLNACDMAELEQIMEYQTPDPPSEESVQPVETANLEEPVKETFKIKESDRGSLSDSVADEIVYEITEYIGTREVINVPDEIDGRKIVGIAKDAFSNNTDLRTLILSEDIEYISFGTKDLDNAGYTGFLQGCSNLNKIEVSAENNFFSSIDGILYNKEGTKLLQCPPGRQGKVIIPEAVVAIEDEAFFNCAGITAISLPESLEDIGNRSFVACFQLAEFKVERGNSHYTAWKGVLFDSEQKTLINYPCRKKQKKYVIPDSVETIKREAFYGTALLKRVTLSDNTTILEAAAFMNCSALENVIFGENLQTIDVDVFKNCTALKEPEFNSNLSSIGFDAFSGCTNISKLVFPESIKYISGEFKDSGIRKITVYNPKAKIALDWGDKTFTIRGYEDSSAQKIAGKKKCKFISLGEYIG